MNFFKKLENLVEKLVIKHLHQTQQQAQQQYIDNQKWWKEVLADDEDTLVDPFITEDLDFEDLPTLDYAWDKIHG